MVSGSSRGSVASGGRSVASVGSIASGEGSGALSGSVTSGVCGGSGASGGSLVGAASSADRFHECRMWLSVR